MPLRDVELPDDTAPLPRRVKEYLAEAEERIRLFLEVRQGATMPGFVPSDFPLVYRSLRALAASRLSPGERFLEWGCGFGVVAGLAASLGFHSHGIEIEPDLLEEAEALARDYDFPVSFALGTFIPPGGEEVLDQVGEIEWLSPGGACGYEALGVDPEGFDVIFAYPWPGEEGVVEDLFDRHAALGALLVTYHGIDEVRVRRRVASGRRR